MYFFELGSERVGPDEGSGLTQSSNGDCEVACVSDHVVLVSSFLPG